MFFFQKCFECVAFIPFAAKKRKKLVSPHCSWATLQQCEFIFVWTNLEWQTKLADHYLVAVLCGTMGEEHLRLFHKGREFFAFPPTGHYSWPPARDAHPLSLTPTGSLKLLLPDSTDCRSLVWPMASKVLFLWMWPLFILKDFSVKEESDLACHR